MRAQDVLVACKLAVSPARHLTIQDLSSSLQISLSDVHGALQRNLFAGLCVRSVAESPTQYAGSARRGHNQADHQALREFLVHGIPYVFPARLAAVSVGLPTAMSEDASSVGGNRLPIVWASAEGNLRGESLAPIHKSVPLAALGDPRLHSLLSAIDALRLGDRSLRPSAIARIENILGAVNL